MNPPATPTLVRGLDRDVWRELRAEAIRHGLKPGQLLTLIAQSWLASHDCAAFQPPTADPK